MVTQCEKEEEKHIDGKRDVRASIRKVGAQATCSSWALYRSEGERGR